MNASAAPATVGESPPQAPGIAPRRTVVIVHEQIEVPAWVDDLESYRRWARSDD